jgi:hypothetical protein
MKTQKKKEKKEDYSKHRRRWQREDILQLSHHFHKITTSGEQYTRTSEFRMNKDDVEKFDKMKNNIAHIEIHLGLKKRDKKKQTFFPILKVIGKEGNEDYFKLDPIENLEERVRFTAEVPDVFKEMICKNWDEIDTHLIDDLFTARKKDEVNGKKAESTVRVLHYKVNDAMIETVIQKLEGIHGITLYSGIDMNKFSNKELISFTPVLGFKYTERNENKETLGLKGVLEFLDGKEAFIEYSSPCPPTC